MSKLEIPKKEKRNKALTVRLPEDTVEKLKQIAERHEVSQADVIKALIEKAYSDLKPKRK